MVVLKNASLEYGELSCTVNFCSKNFDWIFEIIILIKQSFKHENIIHINT